MQTPVDEASVQLTSSQLRAQMHRDAAWWVPAAVRDAVRQLQAMTAGVGTRVDPQALDEVQELLARREVQFCAHLVASVRSRLEHHDELLTDTGVVPLMPAGSQVFTARDADGTLAQARIVQEIESRAHRVLFELSSLVARLSGLREVSAQANPLSPAQVASALMRSVKSLDLLPPARRLLLDVLAQSTASRLPEVYARYVQWLRQSGVSAPGDGGEPLPYTPARAARLTPLQTLRELAAWGQENHQRAPSDGTLRILDEPVALFRQDGTIDLLLDHLAQLMAGKPAVQTLVSRLQPTARKVAATDPGLWQSLEHPLWRLLERIWCTATATSLDEPAMRGLHAALERTLQSLGGSAADALRLRDEVDRLEFAVTGVMAEAGARLVPEPAGLQSRARKAELIEELREQLAEQLHHQLGRTTVPPALQRFLMEGWAEVLYTATQLGSDALTRRAALVDDLLACLSRPAGQPVSEPQLRSLLNAARDGLLAAGLPQVHADSMVRALMPVLQCPPKPGAAARPSAPGAPNAEARGASLTDVGALHGALPTVPIGIVEGTAQSQHAEDECARWLDGLQVGDRLRLHLESGWANVQLRWRNPDASVFVVIPLAPAAAQQMSYTRQAMGHLRRAGMAATLERGELLAKVFESLMATRPQSR